MTCLRARAEEGTTDGALRCDVEDCEFELIPFEGTSGFILPPKLDCIMLRQFGFRHGMRIVPYEED